MKIINFVNPSNTWEAYSLLVQCCYSGFQYEQTSDYLKGLGYYIPEDQFIVFNELQDIMFDLDIGNRQNEY
jgi:hypothetical protein